MSFRKRGIDRENTKDSAESQEINVASDKDDVSTSTAAREMRRREREHKLKNKEMTEEEMMALALRLSEQEANITAQRLQEEEEAMKKALQDSMFAESKSLIDADYPSLSSRRKLVYSNGESQTVTECSTTDPGEFRGHVNRTRKRRRVEGSPLMEMPDLSQTQPSPSSSESAALGSPNSGDSTQIEDCDLPQSPVFPSSSVQVEVRIPKLDHDQLECTASGFTLCTQESVNSAQSSHCQQPAHSPTFPKSPALCSKNSPPKAEETNSQILHLGDDTELSQEPHTSPVFGQTDCKSALQVDTEATVLAFSSQESSISFCLEKDVYLSKSPVFSKTQGGSDRDDGKVSHSPVFGTNGKTVTTCEEEVDEEDKEVEEEQNISQMEPTVDMTLHWSEEEEDNTPPVVSPSPVFPEESRVLHTANEDEEAAPSQTQCRPSAPQSGSAVSEDPGVSGDSAPQSTVHYYWGVPFCPQGLDPGQYTKVIVAQMEVYEKSLKQAHRGLLNKAKWGEPILPQTEKCPSPEPNSPQIVHPTRRSRRLKGKLKELESEEEVEELTEDSQGCQRNLWEEDEEHKEGDNEIQQNTEKETREEEEEGQQKEPVTEAVLEDQREDETQVESDCEVCPETQLSDDNTQELTLPSQPLVRSPDIEMVQVDSPNVPEPQSPPTREPQEPMEQGPESPEEPMESTELALFKPGNMDLGGPHCETKSKESSLQSPDLDQNLEKNLASEEIPDPDQVPDPGPDLDPDPGPDLIPAHEVLVQCPICSQVFPSDRIEMHAAFCDGEPAPSEKASPKPWRKRTRRGETEDTNQTDSGRSVAQAQEKCYICLKAVPLSDYSLHTDRCLQRPALRTATTGGLLSALDKSEPRDSVAGPSGSTAHPQEVIDLVDDDEEDSVSLIQISNSPIRSFTSISDAQDCLIDFSRQHLGKRPGTRQGTKPGTKHRSKRR